MPRRKLSEATAKQLIGMDGQTPYAGASIDVQGDWRKQVRALPPKAYVVKVDQAVKRRKVHGLLKLDRSPQQVAEDIQQFMKSGYRYFVVEPMVPHGTKQERYIALARDRRGLHLTYSLSGGVDIEENRDSLKIADATDDGALRRVAAELGVPEGWLQWLRQRFEEQHMVFMELNPVVAGNEPVVLDAAVEVDDAAALQAGIAWTDEDFRSPTTQREADEVRAVRELAVQSQASFSLELLNPDGAIFVLLAGGGASVVVADEVANAGAGELLANYGEASGNPKTAEMKVYATQIITLLLASRAPRKVLIIGGGVANFTDVAATFTGIIQALTAYSADLQKQGVTVFVRRGGPNEAAGLVMMREFLDDHHLLGGVSGPERVLTDMVRDALQEVVHA